MTLNNPGALPMATATTAPLAILGLPRAATCWDFPEWTDGSAAQHRFAWRVRTQFMSEMEPQIIPSLLMRYVEEAKDDGPPVEVTLVNRLTRAILYGEDTFRHLALNTAVRFWIDTRKPDGQWDMPWEHRAVKMLPVYAKIRIGHHILNKTAGADVANFYRAHNPTKTEAWLSNLDIVMALHDANLLSAAERLLAEAQHKMVLPPDRHLPKAWLHGETYASLEKYDTVVVPEARNTQTLNPKHPKVTDGPILTFAQARAAYRAANPTPKHLQALNAADSHGKPPRHLHIVP